VSVGGADWTLRTRLNSIYIVGRDILDLENKAAESSHLVNAWARTSSCQFSAPHGTCIQLVVTHDLHSSFAAIQSIRVLCGSLQSDKR